jgi:hypothetical protein
MPAPIEPITGPRSLFILSSTLTPIDRLRVSPYTIPLPPHLGGGEVAEE